MTKITFYFQKNKIIDLRLRFLDAFFILKSKILIIESELITIIT